MSGTQVLDDNKKLCLPNSEIIAMAQNMNMIFEVADLAVASPATVSRCGMVYLEPHQLGWEPLRDSWVNTIPVKDRLNARVVDLMDWLLPPTLTFVRKELKQARFTHSTRLPCMIVRRHTFQYDVCVNAVDMVRVS